LAGALFSISVVVDAGGEHGQGQRARDAVDASLIGTHRTRDTLRLQAE